MEQTFYGDYIELDGGNFDLKLILNIVSGDGKNKEPQVRIIMSWPQAKLLLYGLQTFLKAFEMYNGRIRVPRATWPVKIDSRRKKTSLNPSISINSLLLCPT